MLHHDDLKPLLETKTDVLGSDGGKIGTLGQIYLDDGTDLPNFATVHTGLFGAKENFVPLSEAEISGGQLYVKFTKNFVKQAPIIDATGHLTPEDEDRLYDYYSQAGLGQEHDRDPASEVQPHGPGPVGLEPDAERMQDPGARIRTHGAGETETDAAPPEAAGETWRHSGSAAHRESPGYDRLPEREAPGRAEDRIAQERRAGYGEESGPRPPRHDGPMAP